MRIPEVVEALLVYWTANPDLRLCQIVGNLLGTGDISSRGYNTEDDVVLDYLRSRCPPR